MFISCALCVDNKSISIKVYCCHVNTKYEVEIFYISDKLNRFSDYASVDSQNVFIL